MLKILANRDFTYLFTAQVVALVGTGFLTVGLGLLAYDLAGAQAGAVLGIAYTIKMIAYVGLSPVAHALVSRLPRKSVLIAADLIRAGVALCLPFVDQVWQVYGLIFVLQTASATFTPAFQSVIPDILTEEEDYTRALSLSRLAYDLENLLSPALAALVLTVVAYNALFIGTVAGFAVSAFLVARALVPVHSKASNRPFIERLTRGTRIYLATPRLRGLLALNLTAAGIGAFVLVNTVVLVRDRFGLSEADVALIMACFGGGSMLAALILPRILGQLSERQVMNSGAVLMLLAGLGAAVMLGNPSLNIETIYVFWIVIGFSYSVILTPSGRLLRISAHAEDRPAVFTAQFALSHACWLLTYPLAGFLGLAFGLEL
ncbi:MAG: MFS transporter, partial [Paracoccaceae bacterium]|nr:MFS transporter [Paracoccaceae bacterium]